MNYLIICNQLLSLSHKYICLTLPDFIRLNSIVITCNLFNSNIISLTFKLIYKAARITT